MSPRGLLREVRDNNSTMNRLESLPDDIIEHIFRIEHSLNFKMSLSAIKTPYRRKVAYDSHIWSVFFASNMTKQDIREWYVYTCWLDIFIYSRGHHRKLQGLTSDFLDEMERCIYVGLYKDFLCRLRQM